jgi:hypothetical protein
LHAAQPRTFVIPKGGVCPRNLFFLRRAKKQSPRVARDDNKDTSFVTSFTLTRRRTALTLCLLLATATAGASELRNEAAQGFDQYVRLTERRLQGELGPGGAFLWVDTLPEPRRAVAYARLQRGEVVSSRMQTAGPTDRISTPGALIHHWVGTVFIPGATLSQVLGVVEDYDHHSKYYKPDIEQSRKIEQRGDDFKVHYRLRKKKVITVILDTDYQVRRRFLDASRAYSNSYSTRIAQVEHAGEPDEQELPPGNDGGYMWRLNSYWRFSDNGHGVYVQCEAISLTRDIPAGLNWLVGSLVESIPRESLEFTLKSTSAAVLYAGTRAAPSNATVSKGEGR